MDEPISPNEAEVCPSCGKELPADVELTICLFCQAPLSGDDTVVEMEEISLDLLASAEPADSSHPSEEEAGPPGDTDDAGDPDQASPAQTDMERPAEDNEASHETLVKPPETPASTRFEPPPTHAGAPKTIAEGNKPAPRKTVSDSAAVSDADPDAKYFGPYKVLEEIGRGGMGIVYKAFDPGLKRVVALKVLIGGEHATPDAIARFQREAESVAKLGHHPGIVPVFDMGSDGNLHYFAMAFVEGKPLSRLIADHEITVRRAMILTVQVARALHFAHENGVLHRDIKPDNILVDKEGKPSLTDFGLAKDVKQESGLTVSGTAMGTPQYMSPEQAEGDLEHIDARSDVYGLGATLYEMLTFQPPFSGTTYHNVIYKVMKVDPDLPRKLNPGVPRDAETICLKSIEKEAGRRYRSCEEMADDIERFLDGDAINARPASVIYRVSKKVKRNLALYLMGTVATVLLAAAGVFFLGVKPAMDRDAEIRQDTTVLDEALQKRMGPQNQCDSLMNKAKIALEEGRFEACCGLCDQVLDTFGPMQGKSFDDVPHVRNQELLTREAYRPLFEAYSFPLAQTLALKAECLNAAGDENASLHEWLLAYARAKQSPNAEESAVSAPALLQIGRRLLSLRDLERATNTFQKFLRTYPKHELADRALYGLAEALWSEGRFRAALEVFKRARHSDVLTPEEREDLEWYLGKCELLSCRVTVLKPEGRLFFGDTDGDGQHELFAYRRDQDLRAFHFTETGFDPMWSIDEKDIFNRAERDPKAKYGWPSWIDFRGKGRGALFFEVTEKGSRNIHILPVSAQGATSERIVFTVPRGHNPQHVRTLDFDGDGTLEIATVERGKPGKGFVWKLNNGNFEKVAFCEFGSFCNYCYTGDTDGDGREELLLGLGEFSDWQVARLGWSEEDGKVTYGALSPFRFLTRFVLTSIDLDGTRHIWINNHNSAEDRRILRGITRPEFILDNGLFRLEPGKTDKPVGLSGGFPGWAPEVYSGNYMARERMFFFHTSHPSGRAMGFRSSDPRRRWALRAFAKGVGLNYHWAGNIDDDRDTEVVVGVGDKFWVFGTGSPGELDENQILGVDTESESLEKLESAILPTAIEMAGMNWYEEALELFQQAREESDEPFHHRRVLLGQADCLLHLGRTEEALAIYKELITTATVGITEEIFSAVKILESRGEWKAIYEMLEPALQYLKLPVQTRTWAEDLLVRTRPLTDLPYKLTVFPTETYDPSYLAHQPLKLIANRQDEAGFLFADDGARHNTVGRVIDYSGGPFRLEARVVFLRHDWATHFRLGMYRISRKDELQRFANGVYLATDPGWCTNLPALRVAMHESGIAQSTGFVTLQEYPVTSPTPVEIVIEYAPSMRSLSMRVHDTVSGKKASLFRTNHSSLPSGKYFLFVWGSQAVVPSVFEGRFRIERFEMVHDSRNNKPSDWEPEQGAFDLLRAGAALCLGDDDKAVELAGRVSLQTPPFEGNVNLIGIGRHASDPSDPIAALIIMAMANLYKGNHKAFVEQLTAAFEAEPAKVYWRLARASELFSKETLSRLGPALRKILLEEDARRARTLMDALSRGPVKGTHDYRHIPDQTFAAWAGNMRRALASGNPQAPMQALFPFLVNTCHTELAEAVYLGTTFEKPVHTELLFREAEIHTQTGDLPRVLRCYERLMEENPGHPHFLNAAAWFLVTVSREDLRHPARAMELAKQAVNAARQPGSPFHEALATYLDTLARANFEAGNYAQAVSIQEEAIANISRREEPQRAHFLSVLEEYKKKLREVSGRTDDKDE